MERLTKKISNIVQDKYSLGSYLQYDFANTDDTNKLLNKLGKFEDFMETFGYESLQHLEFTLDEQNKIIDAYEEENTSLKDKWEDLKKFIQKDHDWNLGRGNNDCALGQRWVLDKIEELEKE